MMPEVQVHSADKEQRFPLLKLVGRIEGVSREWREDKAHLG
jgi:hypothetical protein